MGLSTRDTGGGSGIKSPKNTFVNVDKIIGVKQQSNYKPHESFSDNVDLGIEIEFETPGRDFNVTISVIGNFKRDPLTSDIAGWGAAFKIADVFAVAGIDDFELNEKNEVPEEILKQLVGKELAYLSYVTNQGKMRYWDRFNSADMAEGFGEFFMEDWTRSGYPKNFDPDAIRIKANAIKTEEAGPFSSSSGGVSV